MLPSHPSVAARWARLQMHVPDVAPRISSGVFHPDPTWTLEMKSTEWVVLLGSGDPGRPHTPQTARPWVAPAAADGLPRPGLMPHFQSGDRQSGQDSRKPAEGNSP